MFEGLLFHRSLMYMAILLLNGDVEARMMIVLWVGQYFYASKQLHTCNEFSVSLKGTVKYVSVL